MARPLITVVNDDTLFLELMEEFLSEEGYQTLILKEGDAAYGTIKKKKPDLVVLDIRLNNPEGGFVVVDLMRLDPQTSTIPIIICSVDTKLIQDNEARLREKNCDILMKPFTLDELIVKVQGFIGTP
jgi:DNA-binding response OmpR family regulator